MKELFGLTYRSTMYLSENKKVLEVLKNYLKTITSADKEDVGNVENLSKKDLNDFFEEHGILDTCYRLVESEYEIEDEYEYEKINIPFLHFHTPARAWAYYFDEDYNPSVDESLV